MTQTWIVEVRVSTHPDTWTSITDDGDSPLACPSPEVAARVMARLHQQQPHLTLRVRPR